MGFLSKAFKAVTSPVRSVARSVAKSAAGLFEDITDPFLAPIDSILNTISPRFRVDANVAGQVDIAASVSGGTRHQILFPQLPGSPAMIGDLSGGLLSDLAINTDALRRAETELTFLRSAMRKGVYPHRSDTLHLGISALPTEKFDADVWLHVVARNLDSKQILVEQTLLLKKVWIEARAKFLKRVPVGQEAPSYHQISDELEVSEVVQLSVARGAKFRLQIEVAAHDGAGNQKPELLQKLSSLEIWLERRNRGFSEVLHQMSCHEPKQIITTAFPIDRREYISDGDAYEMEGIGSNESLKGGVFSDAADSLGEAVEALSDAHAVPAAGTPVNPFVDAVAARIRRSDRARECLWKARRDLGRLQNGEGEFDFRLRYKLRLENIGNTAQRVDRLTFKNGAQDGGQTVQMEINQVDLPPLSSYEITIYPVNSGRGESQADLQMVGNAVHCTLSLIAGLGVAESTLISRAVAASNPGAADSASLSWIVRDCAVARKN